MKRLDPIGIASKHFDTVESARGHTYTTTDDKLVPTQLAFSDNPCSFKYLTARTILDIGCGIGRNLPWILHNTRATYIGLDPNASMRTAFAHYQKDYLEHEDYIGRILLVGSFDEIPYDIQFDAVVCTFVFQHITFRSSEEQMNVTDITQEVFKRSTPNAPWLLYEHDQEERGWIDRWFKENNISPFVYSRNYMGIPELTHRGPHHLIIFETP
jgi:2-polyprenyl-3-methyl-5-hydroxy-6-metoxy-1,4-benzoquinol methylase